MPKELAVELVRQAGAVLAALVWAALALALVLLFRRQIVHLVEGRNLSFEGLGVKVAVSRATTAAALVEAAEAKTAAAPAPGDPPLPAPPPAPDGWDRLPPEPAAIGVPPPPTAPPPAPSPAPARAATTPAAAPSSVAPQALDVLLDRSRARTIADRRILWVDDNPRSVANEAGAFRALGIQVDHALDTDAAIERLQVADYDLVISDMTRGGESEAGLILIRTMRADNIDLPVVIYTGVPGAERSRAAKAAGAMLVTSSPTTLFEAVVKRLA